MKSIQCLAALVLLATVSAALPSQSSSEIRRFPVQDHGELELRIPTGWQVTSQPPRAGLPTQVILEAPSHEALLISAFASQESGRDLGDDTAVRAMTEQDGRKMLPTAVEPELVLHDLKGGPHTGTFYTLTDKALIGVTPPPPGQFLVLTQGHLTVGELHLHFTLLTNESTSPVRDAGLAVLSGAVHALPISTPAAPAAP